ncbi:hypothetical protein SAM23877_3822 [Streptomyces ambofaciens ATCC 23877]|uniref:Uncharacterized protein n=1 Tax=Streptomyces ambofaciens (strain ATCC 23877 / 3486 / DSM 40053 / JCM 4204 / NBRC 12836 / NRRL B-2516) TaxID=278992 RepID=A0A0K2AVL1_STRA7|nr:hypothetical protein SAM23877_3822 [Streptomyces ambofaciens ATCC 23877]
MGCSGWGDQYARVRIVSSAWSRVGRCRSISWCAVSSAAMRDQLLVSHEPAVDSFVEFVTWGETWAETGGHG